MILINRIVEYWREGIRKLGPSILRGSARNGKIGDTFGAAAIPLKKVPPEIKGVTQIDNMIKL